LARALATGITNTTIGTPASGGVIFAGALKQNEVNNKVIPAIQQLLVPRGFGPIGAGNLAGGQEGPELAVSCANSSNG
jgi:hypothetical protein